MAEVGQESGVTSVALDSAESVLAAVPHLLGFEPVASVVVIAIDGKRVGMVMRVDIPGSGEVGAMVAQCAPAILRQAPTSVLVIGYESAVGDAAGAVAAFGECLQAAGVSVDARLLVCGSQWRHADCPSEAGVVPVDDPAALKLRVSSGVMPAPSRAVLEDRVSAGSRSGGVGAECHRITPASVSVLSAAQAWGAVLDSVSPLEMIPDHVVARAAVSLTGAGGGTLRDALIAHLCPRLMGADDLHMPCVRALRSVLPTVAGNLEGRAWMTDRLVQVCAALPDAYAAPALTVLGTFAWWNGDGALARIALKRAITADPDYRLAHLVMTPVHAGVSPQEWRSR